MFAAHHSNVSVCFLQGLAGGGAGRRGGRAKDGIAGWVEGTVSGQEKRAIWRILFIASKAATL
jgi:hypothetical protein